MDPQQRRLRTIRGPGSCRTIELRMFAACCNKNNVFVTGTRTVRDLSMQHPIGWQETGAWHWNLQSLVAGAMEG